MINENIQGWSTTLELTWLSQIAEKMESIVEVGAWKGRSTYALASSCPGMVYSVDTFEGSEAEKETFHAEAKNGSVLRTFVENCSGFQNLEVLVGSSLEAACEFEDGSVDMVFLDGGHTYEEVKADIEAWAPKARKILCGHDYTDKRWGVEKAVNEKYGQVYLADSIWIVPLNGYELEVNRPKFKVFIGSPVYKLTEVEVDGEKRKYPGHPKFVDSIQKCMEHPGLEVDFRAVIGDAHIERARAVVLAEYLDYTKPWDFFLMVDSDIEFDAEQLYNACARNLPIVGGPYSFKSATVSGKAATPVFRPRPGCTQTEDDLLECEYLGGGYTLVRDDLVHKMCKTYRDTRFRENPDMHNPPRVTYALWNPIVLKRTDWGEDTCELLSEDYSFCDRVNQMGYKQYLDLRIILRHWDGDVHYSLPLTEKVMEAN